jgi:hypothetical protein
MPYHAMIVGIHGGIYLAYKMGRHGIPYHAMMVGIHGGFYVLSL